MSNDETAVQMIKILLAIIAMIVFAKQFQTIIDLLRIIVAK